jgi:2-dehydropantoate 2-reductase
VARVLVVGPGAIGGVLAALAHERGHDVALAVRTPFRTLVVRTGDVEREVGVRVLTDPADAGRADWVLLATKAQDTPSTAGWLAAATGEGTVVVVAQNGVDHEARVRDLVAAGTRVLPAAVVLGAEALGPGHVVHHGYGRLTVPAGADADALAEVVGGGADGLEIDGTDDMRTATWRKLISNAVANPITALTGRRNGVLAEPATAELVRGLAREVVAAGVAEGADLSEDDVTALVEHYATMPPSLGTSMLYDRLAGRPLEHEYLTGAVVAAADRHGVDVPVTRRVVEELRARLSEPYG